MNMETAIKEAMNAMGLIELKEKKRERGSNVIRSRTWRLPLLLRATGSYRTAAQTTIFHPWLYFTTGVATFTSSRVPSRGKLV